MATESIEDIILDHDQRGVSALRPHVPGDFCAQAAGLVLAHPGTAIIATGFYILSGKAAETDGPPGAVAIGDALRSLDYEVIYVTDRHAASLMAAIVEPGTRIVDFPITDREASKKFAGGLLDELDPAILISIERCGPSSDGVYRNMRNLEITPHTAQVDTLFTDHPYTVAVGDGGNEIGMGLLASRVANVPTLVKFPCVTPATKLIISSVSNWGGYGLVAAISLRKGRDLLPSAEADTGRIKRLVNMGAVDGFSGKNEPKVDGFTLEENSQVLERLHAFLTQRGIQA